MELKLVTLELKHLTVDLWVAHADGYLAGTMLAVLPETRHSAVYIVARFEDIVCKPGEEMAFLADIGLPRNTSAFSPIEEPVSADASGRAEVIDRLRHGGHNLDAESFARLRAHLALHVNLLSRLEYPLPS